MNDVSPLIIRNLGFKLRRSLSKGYYEDINMRDMRLRDMSPKGKVAATLHTAGVEIIEEAAMIYKAPRRTLGGNYYRVWDGHISVSIDSNTDVIIFKERVNNRYDQCRTVGRISFLIDHSKLLEEWRQQFLPAYILKSKYIDRDSSERFLDWLERRRFTPSANLSYTDNSLAKNAYA